MMLEVKNLVKKFDKNIAVNNISFNVEEGRIFGLLGRNGAGKSTIFRTILNIFKPDSGEVLYNGKKINHKITDKIGYLPEEGSLIPSYTVLEQFIYYGILKSMSEDEVKKQAIYWLERFNILDYANRKIKELSKGNRQKIQFIIAVLHNPDLLILDEPFSGLDPVSVEEFKKMVLEQKEKGKVIIFSSHRMEHVEQLCDDILLMNKGKEILKGNLQEIKAKYGNKELNDIFIKEVGATDEE
ncbi:MAG: ATP-binding cassette domain-containing protein [Clostridiales bacterium]|nr:ATP-binding cassette domain-containing protein [Clostridiales bacterium]